MSRQCKTFGIPKAFIFTEYQSIGKVLLVQRLIPALSLIIVWSWNFVHDIYGQGEPFRCLTVKDEATRLCLAIEVGRSLTHNHVIEVLRQLIARYGRLRYLQSDTGQNLLPRTSRLF